ncbi:MAG: helix-turn-helix transcriptional regulator [Thaumarchaeota archaeon]|nr:helix-turn-helix transcriptional regulator [Nitrososphaerota archaeon]RLG06745.1 MAG: transcriptional regulator [Nitrososphaerota archaeon]
MIVRNRLREFRARYRMTQEELARSVGVTRQTIIAIENGKYLPSLKLAFKLAKAFNVKIEDLFEYRESEDDE